MTAPSTRPPVTVVVAVALLAASVAWWLVELPDAFDGVVGPAAEPTVVVALVLIALPMLVELAAAVLVALRQGWGRFLLVPVLLYAAYRLVTSGSVLVVLDLVLIGGAAVLLFLPASRAWFAPRVPAAPRQERFEQSRGIYPEPR